MGAHFETFVPPESMNDLPPVLEDPDQFFAAELWPEPSLQNESPSASLPGMMSPHPSPFARSEFQTRSGEEACPLCPLILP